VYPEDFTRHLELLQELKAAAAANDVLDHGLIDAMIAPIEYGKHAHQIGESPEVLLTAMPDKQFIALIKRQASPIILFGPTTCSSPKQNLACREARDWNEAIENIVFGQSMKRIAVRV